MTDQTSTYLKTSEFQDGQVPGSITPSRMRDLIDSFSEVVTSTQTTNYTLVLGDAGTTIEMNSGGGVALSVPPNSSVAFDVGTLIGVYNMGAGQVTLTAGGGVTIRSSTGTLTLRAQYSTAFLRKRATNEWVASGDLT